MVNARAIDAVALIRDWWRSRHAFIWITAVLAAVIRISAVFPLRLFASDPWLDPWAFGWEYGRIARWLVERNVFSLDGVVPTSETDPLYSFIIAPFFYAFGSFTISAGIALVLFQIFLCCLTTWAIFLLAEKLYGPAEARISALLFAFYPASVFFAISRIGPSSLAVLLICLVFLIALAIPGAPWRLWLAGLGGFLLGLLVLTSGHTLSLFPVIPLWFFLVSKGQQVRMALTSLVFIGTATLVLVPWSVRNSMVLGEPSFSKSNLDYHLWVGNNPSAKGYYIKDSSHAIRPQGENAPPYYRMAFAWIAHNPAHFIKLTVKRVIYFWYISPEREQSRILRIHAWIFLSIVGVALYGLIPPWGSLKKVSLLLLFLGIFPLLFYLTAASFYRHRFHIEPFALILASHGLYSFWLVWVYGRIKAEDSPRRAHGVTA